MTQEALAGSILVRLDLSDEFQMFAINRYPPLKNTYEKLVQSLSGSSHPPEPSGLSRSLKAFYNDFPFWFQLFMVPDSRDMAASLFDLRQHCHNPKKNDASEHYDPSGKACNHTANNPADLWSLYCPVHATSAHSTDIQTACRSGNCGGYFSPLTQSTGATYAPIHAAVYLSWVLFLADDLQTGLQELLDEFRNIDCRHWGCKTKSSGACQCSPGQHGINTECSCDSVVHCGGVLPLLYRHGFQFHSPHTLSGGKDGATKRSCDKFHSALSNVLSPDAPLHNLLMAIDEFMYYVRFRFMSLISSFWIFSLAILLYFIVYGTDVLHFKSHVHLPSSHTVPPIGLLTTGKAPALTKLTYYMP
ncbi:extracellular matrix-binding ebh, putative [Babesia caballi]|uniref:Extracellular matrix-binding ebh, putative n=1 Tax=Babesia caballi TaxID=5871 RepID=A0AAV4LXF3_BABCB|nr:extracellular matrix-binding ebh, putative [Babesia caballi]